MTKNAVHIRKPYDRHARVQLGFKLPSMAKQSFKKECDINEIMKKFEAGQVVGHVNRYRGRYEDLPAGVDFQAALNIVADAREAFADLPSKIRTRFRNDAGYYLEFVSNPVNLPELRELGLAKIAANDGAEGGAAGPSKKPGPVTAPGAAAAAPEAEKGA